MTDSECLEPLLITVVYLVTMISDNKKSREPKSAPLSSFRQRLSYVLALLFVFVSLNPAHASMAVGQGMMGIALDISDSTVQAAMTLNHASHSSELAGEGNTAHVMAMTMNMSEDDCQSDCDCCPGLCSVYLPSNLTPSTFFSANFTLADSAFLGKVSTSARLFRPPISH